MIHRGGVFLLNDLWAGFAGTRPGSSTDGYSESLVRETTADYQRLLRHVGREYADCGLYFEPTLVSTPESIVFFCGRGSGFVRDCPGGHSWYTPLGCGSSWCLACQGLRADIRAERLHRDMNALGAAVRGFNRGKPATIGRIVFTLHPNHHATARTRRGSGDAIKRACQSIAHTLGIPISELAVCGTFHPTSSSKPWVSFPHFEVYWLHAQLFSDSANPLPWHNARSGHIIDADSLRESWGKVYPDSVNLEVSWFKWSKDSERYLERDGSKVRSLRSSMRYSLRPFTEDVWHALAERPVPSLWMVNGDDWGKEPLVRGSVRTGRVPSDEVVEGLSREGGVTLWRGYHRVRRYGYIACRGFKDRLAVLEKALGPLREEEGGSGVCPECDGGLKVRMGDTRPCLIHARFDVSEFDLLSGVLVRGETYAEVEP